MHAVVFGNVTAIIQRLYSRRFSLENQDAELKEFFHLYKIPKPLKRKVQEFYQNSWQTSRGGNYEKVRKKFNFFTIFSKFL